MRAAHGYATDDAVALLCSSPQPQPQRSSELPNTQKDDATQDLPLATAQRFAASRQPRIAVISIPPESAPYERGPESLGVIRELAQASDITPV